MKMIFLAILFTLGLAVVASASEPETLVVRVGEHKMTARGKITVKFVEVLEDSRCPPDVNCIWAGNAKLKITLAKGKKAAKTFELNSTLKPDMILFEGYEIRFVDFVPRPGEQVKRRAFEPTATLSVSKHVK